MIIDINRGFSVNKTIIGNVFCGVLLLGWSGISFGMEPAGLPHKSEWDQYLSARSRSHSESGSFLETKPASSHCVHYEEHTYPEIESGSYGEEVRIGTVIKAFKKPKKNQRVYEDVLMTFDYEDDKCEAKIICYENKGLEDQTDFYIRFINNSNVSIEDAHLKKIKAAAVEEKPFAFKIESKAKHTANVYKVTRVRTLGTAEDIDKYNINKTIASKQTEQHKEKCSIQ
jgi:hypothetical protein